MVIMERPKSPITDKISQESVEALILLNSTKQESTGLMLSLLNQAIAKQCNKEIVIEDGKHLLKNIKRKVQQPDEDCEKNQEKVIKKMKIGDRQIDPSEIDKQQTLSFIDKVFSQSDTLDRDDLCIVIDDESKLDNIVNKIDEINVNMNYNTIKKDQDSNNTQFNAEKAINIDQILNNMNHKVQSSHFKKREVKFKIIDNKKSPSQCDNTGNQWNNSVKQSIRNMTSQIKKFTATSPEMSLSLGKDEMINDLVDEILDKKLRTLKDLDKRNREGCSRRDNSDRKPQISGEKLFSSPHLIKTKNKSLQTRSETKTYIINKEGLPSISSLNRNKKQEQEHCSRKRLEAVLKKGLHCGRQ